ncbi:MAG: hypothetical protein JRG72_04490 [Deltaproteobacteria bacterium]|nr:hypothetical protein [Deltaproteobacteria bacterium]
MIIRKVDIWHLNLAFKSPVKHNLATHRGSENIILKVTTDGGMAGYGEGIPRTFVTGETIPESLSFLKEELIPIILRTSLASGQIIFDTLAHSYSKSRDQAYPAAFCAVEMALLDAAGKTWGKSLGDFLGPRLRERVVYSAVLPMASPTQMARFFDLVKTKNMRFLKLKVGNNSDLEILKSAREKLGWEIDIRVDANAAWTANEAIARIEEMTPYRISAVEQPVAKTDFAGLQKVSAALPIPIIADESICTEEDAQRLIELQACQIFNLRLSKCGGLGRATRIKQMAEKAGIRCQLGCHVGETSILAAAGRYFALCNNHLAYVEGSFAPYLLTKDPVCPSVVFDNGGLASGFLDPGLGVRVMDSILEELAISKVTIGE